MTLNKDIIEQSLFNITKLIKSTYENNKLLPDSFIKTIDFLEKSHKTIYINFKSGTQNYELDETLISNIVQHLPVEAYLNYMQFRWIYGGKEHDNPLIRQALWHRKYPFIKSFLKFGEQFLNDNKIEEGFYGTRKEDYLRNVLNPILDLSNNIYSFDRDMEYSIKKTKQPYQEILLNNTKDAQAYLEIFNIALEQFKIISENTNKLYGIKKKINIKQWLKIYPLVDSYRRNDNEEFIEQIVKNEFLYPIFKEINSQKSLIKEKYFKIAFLNANHKVINEMQPILQFSEEQLQELFKQFICRFSEEEIELFSQKSDYNKSIGDNYLILQEGIDLAKKYIQDFSDLKISDYLGLLLKNDSNTLQEIKTLFNINKDTLLIEDLTINELHHATKLFYEFVSSHQLIISKHNRRNVEEVPHNNFNLYLGSVLKQIFPEFITETITKEQQIKINSFIAAEFLSEIDLKSSNISQQDLLIHFRAFVLSQDLDQKTEKSKFKI